MREPDFTAQEIADELQCSPRMVWKLLKDGRLQSYRVGRQGEAVTVREVLTRRYQFERSACCDPLEPGYRRWKRCGTLFPSTRRLGPKDLVRQDVPP